MNSYFLSNIFVRLRLP
jgi:GntR family transcriptional regulator, transcriptional repressor for pyruvate dehydrogenase complex